MIGSDLSGGSRRFLVVKNGRYDAVPQGIPPPAKARYGGEIVRLNNTNGPATHHVLPAANQPHTITNVRPLLWRHGTPCFHGGQEFVRRIAIGNHELHIRPPSALDYTNGHCENSLCHP